MSDTEHDHLTEIALNRWAKLVPPRYSEADWQHVRQEIRDLIPTTKTLPPSIVLTGATGRGKSYTLWALAKFASTQRTSWECWRLADLVAVWVDWSDEGKARQAQIDRRLRETNLLLLDDVGAGVLSESSDNRFGALIDSRYNAMRCTAITTNLDPSEGGDLAKVVGLRTWERLLLDGAIAYRCGGDNLRRTTKETNR